MLSETHHHVAMIIAEEILAENDPRSTEELLLLQAALHDGFSTSQFLSKASERIKDELLLSMIFRVSNRISGSFPADLGS